jgi:hypothetical protein
MADLATQWPATPEGNAVNFKINTPTQTTETFSGKMRRVGLGVSYYSWEMRWTNLKPLDAGTINGYSAQALGQQFSFEIVIPKVSFTKLTDQTGNTPVVATSISVGATSVQLSGCGANRNVLAAGDYFKFQNHTKVYMCVSPCVSNGSGVATLFFSGPCVNGTGVAAGQTVRINQVPFTAIMDEEAQEYEVGIGGITNMSIAMREIW